jgi:hypothetical protein
MRAVLVYDSVDDVHDVAAHIADGLSSRYVVDVEPAGDAAARLIAECDLLVVGGATHAHGLSSSFARMAHRASDDLAAILDEDAMGPALRYWFHTLEALPPIPAAAFATRAPGAVTVGDAARAIARRLRTQGFHLAVGPATFEVDRLHRLECFEDQRAAAWGATLATALMPVAG